MKKIVIGDIVSRAWDLAVKHWPVFVVISIITSLCSNFGLGYDPSLLTGLGQNPDPQAMAEALREAMNVNYPLLLIGLILATYLGFVVCRMLYNAATIGRPYTNLGDAFKVDFVQVCVFFCVEIVFGLIVGLGTCLCILPGIFLAIRLMFAPMLVAVDGVSFGEAFTRSWQMTKGSFWDLFLLGLTAIGIAILGLCACCVGVYFAEVIINFMLVLAFLVLRIDNQPEVVVESTDYTEVQ